MLLRARLVKGVIRAALVVLVGFFIFLPAAGVDAVIFNLIPDAGTSAQAIQGFQDAANLWSAVLLDPVTINLEIGFTALGAGILGQSGSTTMGVTLTNFRNALTADGTSASDATAIANVPGGTYFNFYTSNPNTGVPFMDNNNSANNLVLDINTANAKALGLLSPTDGGTNASITFSTAFTWDFNPTNGITAGAYDFVGVAAHEIGHALGFVSGADIVDYYQTGGPGGALNLDPFRVFTPLDMFRYSATSFGLGIIDVAADTRTKYYSINGGATSIATFSTGVYHGDGRQASHWKDNLGIGIMDPTAATGELLAITATDIQLFDVIGWDLSSSAVPEPSSALLLLTGLTILYRRRR